MTNLPAGLSALAFSCSRPFYQMLADAVTHPQNFFNWVLCPYTTTGLGLTGVGFIVLATGFLGIKNWSESWTLPLTWLALAAPVLAATMLPGAVTRQIAGIVTLAFAMTMIGLYYWWR